MSASSTHHIDMGRIPEIAPSATLLGLVHVKLVFPGANIRTRLHPVAPLALWTQRNVHKPRMPVCLRAYAGL